LLGDGSYTLWLFSRLHEIAAQRGEGLRPDLVRLLERHRMALQERYQFRFRVADPDVEDQFVEFRAGQRSAAYAAPCR
jgi:hypothetical protein